MTGRNKKKSKFEVLYQKGKKLTSNHINAIFLGVTLLTLALVQIIIESYTNSLIFFPQWVSILNLITLAAIFILTFFLVIFLDFGFLWKILVVLVFFGVYFSLIANFLYLVPVPYVVYTFVCPDNLDEHSNMNLEVINKGKIISKNEIFIEFLNPNNKSDWKPTSSEDATIITFPNEAKNFSISFKKPKFNNGSITLRNKISCSKIAKCVNIEGIDSEIECKYYCRDNKCTKLK